MSKNEQETEEPASNPGGGGWKWLILAVMLLVGFWFGVQALRNAQPAGAGEGMGPGGMPQGPPPATVVVAPVSLEAIQEHRRVTGSLRAVERADVAAQESGAVVEVKVDVGDSVEKGDLLVKLDDRRVKATLAEAKSMATAAAGVVDERAAEASRAETDLAMKKDLFSQRAVSEREFLDAQREASVAVARQKSAVDEAKAREAALDLLRVRLEDLQVVAPFSGQVVTRHVDPGEWLAAGEAVVTLISSGTVEAWINVPERFMGAISSGDEKFEVVADGTGIRSGVKSIRQVSDIDPGTRLFPVVAEVDDLDGKLVPGQSIHAELAVGAPRELLAVPVDAVIETFNGASVFLAAPDPDGGLPVATKVAVVVAFREDGKVFLESGELKPGDLVVVEGNERLFPGTPLMVEEPGAMEVPPGQIEEASKL
jgi:RND family efflux transporter MFP subunit